MRRPAGALAVVLILLLTATAPAGAVSKPRPTTTTMPETPAVSGHLALTAQTSWLSPGQDFVMQVRVTEVAQPADLELGVAVYSPVRTRDELADTFEGAGLNRGKEGLSLPLADAPRSPDGIITLTLATQDPAAPPRPGAVRLPNPGKGGVPVYPVEVELREKDDGPTVDRLVTHILAVPPHPDGSRLGVTLVLPVHSPPASGARVGEHLPPPVGAASFDELASALASRPSAPVVLSPTPETLESLSATARTTLDQVANAVSGRQVIARPYVAVDLDALGDAATNELAAQLKTGAEVARPLLGTPLVRSTWVDDDHLGSNGLQSVAAAGVTRLVVAESDLEAPPPGRASPLAPLRVTASGAPTMAAVVADGGLASHFDPSLRPEQQVLAAHHTLADLALLDALNSGTVPRATVAAAPRTWRALPGFLEVLLDGIGASPVLAATDLDTDFADVTTAGTARTTQPPVTRSLAGGTRPAGPTMLASKVATARHRLAVHDEVLPSDAARSRHLAEQVLAAESADLPAAEQAARLTTVGVEVDADLGRIHMPPSRSVSLTASTGELPITVFNDAGQDARVAIRLESDKLDFPEGARQVVSLSKQSTTTRFKVRARTAGAVPLRVFLETPDGRDRLTASPSKFTVRQTSVPGLGIALSAVAAAVLAQWWLRSMLRGRRSRRVAAAAT